MQAYQHLTPRCRGLAVFVCLGGLIGTASMSQKEAQAGDAMQVSQIVAHANNCIIAALRSGDALDLRPIVGTMEDYVATRPYLNTMSNQRMPISEARNKGTAWAGEQQKLATECLRSVREFGTRLGIVWAKAEIKAAPNCMVMTYEVQWQGHTMTVIVPLMRGQGRGLLFLSSQADECWVASRLSLDDLHRLGKWHPGVNRKDDLTVIQLLIEKSAESAVLGRMHVYDPSQRCNEEIESIGMTVRFPASFDKGGSHDIEVLGTLGGTLTEIDDTLEFCGATGRPRFPITLVMSDRHIGGRESWAATVYGKVQVFRRVEGAERTFHSPSIWRRVVGASAESLGVTLTFNDDVVVDGQPGPPTLLTTEEIARLRGWKPGENRENDVAVGQSLVRKRATELLLQVCGFQLTARPEEGARGLTLRLPATFDSRHRDKILVLDSGAVLTETGNDTLDFRCTFDLGPHRIVLKDGATGGQKSWSATVDRKVQVFSRVTGTERTFHTPNVDVYTVSRREPSSRIVASEHVRGVTVTLHDRVVVDFSP